MLLLLSLLLFAVDSFVVVVVVAAVVVAVVDTAVVVVVVVVVPHCVLRGRVPGLTPRRGAGCPASWPIGGLGAPKTMFSLTRRAHVAPHVVINLQCKAPRNLCTCRSECLSLICDAKHHKTFALVAPNVVIHLRCNAPRNRSECCH